jgi:hypothetical protein
MRGVCDPIDRVGIAHLVRFRTHVLRHLVWKITEAYAERTNTATMIMTTSSSKRKCAGNGRCYPTSFLEWLHKIAALVHHQGGHCHLCKEIIDVEIADRREIASGHLRRCSSSLQLVESVGLLLASAAHHA